MATKYQVRLADTTTDPTGRGHETTVRCTCGWSVTLGGATAALAVQVAGKARANHLEDAHPGQPLVTGPSGTRGHDLLIGGSTKREHLWERRAVCACGWTATVAERSPDRVAAVVRSRHRAHLVDETGRTPARDYVVLLALLAVVAVVVLLAATAAIDAGAR